MYEVQAELGNFLRFIICYLYEKFEGPCIYNMKKIFFYNLSSPHLDTIESDFFIGESADELLSYSLQRVKNTEMTLKILGTRDLVEFPELLQKDPEIQKAYTKKQFKNNMLLVRDRYIKSPIDKKHFTRMIESL